MSKIKERHLLVTISII